MSTEQSSPTLYNDSILQDVENQCNIEKITENQGENAFLTKSNLIDLITEMKKLGLFDDIISSISGEDYMTKDHLEKQIIEALLSTGRIKLSCLSQQLKVDNKHVDKIITKIIKENSDGFHNVNGDIISRECIDGYLAESNSILQEKGDVCISDLSRRFDLPREFFLKMVQQNIDVIIHGSFLDQNTIVTKDFEERIEEKILEVLLPLSESVLLSDIQNEHDIKNVGFAAAVQNLIDKGKLSGSIKGIYDSATYIPEVVRLEQEKWLIDFLRQNQYLEYSKAVTNGISLSVVKQKCENFGPGIHLKNLFIENNLVNHIDEMLRENLNLFGCFDIMEIAALPVCFTLEDLALILPLFKTLSITTSVNPSATFIKLIFSSNKSMNQFMIINESICFSQSFCVEVCEKLRPFIQKLTFNLCQEKEPRKLSAGTTKKTREGKKDKKSKEEHLQVILKSVIDDYDEVFASFDISDKSIVSVLEEFTPKLFGESYNLIMSSKMDENQINLFHKKSELESSIITTLDTAFIYSHGILHLNDNKRFVRYFLESIGLQLVMLTTHYNAIDINHITATQVEPNSLTDSNYRNNLHLLADKEKQTIFCALEKSINDGKTVDQFLDLFLTCISLCNIYYHKMERRKERTLLKKMIQPLENHLERAVEPATVLHLVVLILFYKKTGCIIAMSGKMVPKLIENIENAKIIPMEIIVKLKDYQKDILRSISKKSTSEERESSKAIIMDGLTTIKKLVD